MSDLIGTPDEHNVIYLDHEGITGYVRAVPVRNSEIPAWRVHLDGCWDNELGERFDVDLVTLIDAGSPAQDLNDIGDLLRFGNAVPLINHLCESWIPRIRAGHAVFIGDDR